MYTSKNFKTKKDLKEAIKSGEKITIYQAGPYGGNEPTEGEIILKVHITQSLILGTLLVF